MSQARKLVVAIVGILGASLFTAAAFADMAVYIPPVNDSVQHMNLRLSADRMFGMVPMTVNLSGMIETNSGDPVSMNSDNQVRIVIESPFLTIRSSGSTARLLDDVQYESTAPGPEPMPLKRAIEIRKPGTYTFRVQVIGTDGHVLSSNEVSVRAL